MKYLIGIDAGGTKSELTAYDLNGRALLNLTGGFGNPSVSLDKTINNIISLIDQCMEIKEGDKCLLIAMGIAGVETGNYAEIIKKQVEDTFKINTIVMNDGQMACKAYFGNEDGILVISGTGSSAYAQRQGQGQIVGGWGHILGDEGSGYHTVMEIFKNITSRFDSNLPYDSLSQAILEEIGGSTRSDIMDFVYSNDKNKIAALFPLVVEYSNKKDKYATILLENAGKYLAQLTERAYNKNKFTGQLTVGLKGGVFHNSDLLLAAYRREIEKNFESFSIIEEDISTTKAVLNLYKDII